MAQRWTVVDLFSGAGGMSYGFHAHADFQVVGAVDAEIGKPSSGVGTLECNQTYAANIGIVPLAADLMTLDPETLARVYGDRLHDGLTVLCSCAPCTGFSRTVNRNHQRDDWRNSLVGRCVDFVRTLTPQIVVMENARELIRGRFHHHYHQLEQQLQQLGYQVHGEVHFLDRFGLAQQRERALVIACRREWTIRTISDLWSECAVIPEATHVRRAIGWLPRLEAGQIDSTDSMHCSPNLGETNTRRLRAIPVDGGSWADLRSHPNRANILTPAMLAYLAQNNLGSHPDVYGRMAWNRPAPTVKRECGHIGNGRYAHPEQDRLCTVREMSILQGFPTDFRFMGRSLANRYRHIGDAVPPLISYQLAAVCKWILSGQKPAAGEWILPRTHLTPNDLRPVALDSNNALR